MLYHVMMDVRVPHDADPARFERLKAEEARLAHRARLLDPRSTDPDYAEEMTRRELGVVRRDEVVVPLD